MITLFFSVTLELDGIIFCLILASVWEAQRSTEGELYSVSQIDEIQNFPNSELRTSFAKRARRAYLS